jgi:HlyD family secretion protein
VKRRHWIYLGGCLVTFAVLAADVAPRTSFNHPSSRTLPGFAEPSAQAVLAADRTAMVTAIHADEGSVVQPGALLAQLDHRVQTLRVKVAEHNAQATHAISLAKLNLATAQRELERVKKMGGAASLREIDDAEDALQAAELELEEAEFDRRQAELDAELQRTLLEEYSIRAPFAGQVLEFEKQVGEVAEEGGPIVTLVQLDPLEVRIDCPLSQAMQMSVGERALVSPIDPSLEPRVGTVIFISPSADAGSQTVRVHIDVPNTDRTWPGGLRVNVALDESVALITPAAGGVALPDAKLSEELHHAR